MTGGEGFDDFFYTSKDGLRLHARIYGHDAAGRRPVVCLPGLTRNARDFHELALFLSSATDASRKVITFDYRGRGGSAYDPEWKNYNIVTEAGDIRPLDEIEADMIRLALGRYRGHMTEVAKRLKIGRSTLYRKMQEYGLEPRA